MNLAKLPFVLLLSTLSATFGYQIAFNYIGKFEQDKKMFQMRMARVDLWSYLLTSVPLFWGLVIILNRDPIFGGAFVIAFEWNDFVTAPLLLVASLGVGAGIARRRWALIR